MDIPRKTDTPAFNMKVVVQETGLKPDTLRAWERRYNILSPRRTPGGHRLYSQRDIDTLKWLTARQDEGLSISRAVELWHQLEAEGQDPLQSVPVADSAQSRPAAATAISGAEIDRLRDGWITACLNFDEAAARHIQAQAFATFPVETAAVELLQRGLSEIGRRWFEGSASVQQEHFASALAMRQLDTLLLATPPPAGKEQLLVACPPGEQHTFSPLLLTLFLRRERWPVVYLGANVPVDRLEQALDITTPRLVVLVAQTLYTAGNLLAMAGTLDRTKIALAYGGAVFSHLPEARKPVPGYFLGHNLPDAAEAVGRILHTAPPPPEPVPVAPDYRQALAHFRQNRPTIEAHVRQTTGGQDFDPTWLEHACEELGNNITAALTLGNLDLLDAHIAWAGGLLVNYDDRPSPAALEIFVKAYAAAVDSHLNRQGRLLRDWFARFIASPNFPEGPVHATP